MSLSMLEKMKNQNKEPKKMEMKKTILATALWVLVAICSFGQTATFDAKGGSWPQGNYASLTISNRTFAHGKWTTLALPFAVSKAQLDQAFGTDAYEVQQLTEVSGNTFVFNRLESPAMEAGKPYLFKYNGSADLSSVTFQNVSATVTTGQVLGTDTHKFKAQLVYLYDWSYLNSGGHYYTLRDGAWWELGWGQGDAANILGTEALFEVPSGTTALISIEGGQGGNGDPSDDPDDPSDPSDLASKIAAHAQISDVPTIYLSIPDVTSVSSWGKEQDADGNDIYRRATIQVVDQYGHLEEFTDPGLSIKVRGNSTASVGNGKRPYRLKFDKDVKQGGVVTETHKHDLLGQGYKKRNWTLLANAFDNSMMRNALTYHIGKYVGMPFCPGYRFVDLVINGEYRGTYQVSDHVEVGTNRVDINEDTDWFLEGVSWTSMTEEPYAGTGEPYFNIKNPEPATTAELDQLKSDINSWREQWLASFDNGSWQKTNDLASLVRYYIAINLTGDLDGWFVFKGYRAPDGPFTWGPLWDKDLAFGNHGDAKDDKMVENYGKCNFEWKIRALQQNRTFMTAVKAKMDELVADGLTDKLMADIDNLADMLSQTQAYNFSIYNINDASWAKVHFPTFPEYAAQLKEWLAARISFVQSSIDSFVENLPAPTEGTYNPANAWWGTGLMNGTTYNMSIANPHRLTAGQWNTFCLPFDATQQQMEQALGCTYELKVHTGMDADGHTMLFGDPATLDIEAGMPYLIKPASQVDSYGVFEDVVYSVNVNNGQNAYNGDGVTFDNQHYFYASLFHGYELSTATDYLFDNDLYTEGTAAFTRTPSDNPHDGMRAYLRVPAGETPAIAFAAAPDVRRQKTPGVTTIYIDTQDGAPIDHDTYVAATMQVMETTLDDATPLGEFTESNLTIKGYGTDTWNLAKKPYRIKFGKGSGHDMTGRGYNKRNWVLLANATDESLLRNAVAKRLGDALQMPFTPGYKFVDLVLNGTYVGTYQLTEHVEADLTRVNVNEDTGWLWQMTNQAVAGELQVEGSATVPYVTIKNPEGEDDEENADIQNAAADYLWRFWTAIQTEDGFSQYVEPSSFINWYLASELLGSYTAFSTFYAYKEASATQLCFGPLWDNDHALGNSSQLDMAALMSDKATVGSRRAMLYLCGEPSPWTAMLAQLWDCDWFAQAVAGRWADIYAQRETVVGLADAFDSSWFRDTWANNYRPQAEGGAGWEASVQASAFSSQIVAPMKTWLADRMDYLNAKIVEQTMDDVATGIHEARQTSDRPTGYYNLNGQYVGERIATGRHGVFIRNGKKQVR